MLPQLSTPPNPRGTRQSSRSGAAYGAPGPAPFTWAAQVLRPQTTGGFERSASGKGLLTPPSAESRPLTSQQVNRGRANSTGAGLLSPTSCITAPQHGGPTEVWTNLPPAIDKALHGHVDASSCADSENERLRSELQSLQAALQHTQSALVDK